MTDTEIIIEISQSSGYRWYWHVCGNDLSGFTWSLALAFPPEEGIGTAFIGCAGETKEATLEEIDQAKRDGTFTFNGPTYPNDTNAAIGLVDILADDGWVCRMDNGLDKTWEVLFTREEADDIYAPGDTLARAICRGFLDVRGKWIESISK